MSPSGRQTASAVREITAARLSENSGLIGREILRFAQDDASEGASLAGLHGGLPLLDEVEALGLVEVGEQVGAHGDRLGRVAEQFGVCLLYTSPSPRDGLLSRMPSSA